MSDTGNLSTLYRPTTFGEVVGQPTAVSALRNIALADGISVRSIFLRGAYGSGKCISGSQRVVTDRGYQKIGLLCNGLLDGFTERKTVVSQWDGSTRVASHLYKESNCIVYKFVDGSGAWFTGTRDHKILALKRGSCVPKMVACGSLEAGDYVFRYLAPAYVSVSFLMNLLLAFVHSSDELNALKSFPYNIKSWSFNSKVNAWATILWLFGCFTHLPNPGSLTVIRAFGEDNLQDTMDLLTYLGLPFVVRPTAKKRFMFDGVMRDTNGVILYELVLVPDANVRFLDVCSAFGRFILSCDESCKFVKESQMFVLLSELVRRPIPSERVPFKATRIDFGNPPIALFNDLLDVYRSLPKEKQIPKKYANLFDLQRYPRMGSAAVRRVFEMLQEDGGVLPEYASCFLHGVAFEVVSRSCSIETVYDLSVPDTHLFLSGGVLNHNTTLARIFGKALNCSNLKKTGDVCNECNGCKSASAVNSQTVLEYDASKIGNVEGIKSLSRVLSVVPDGRRLVILDETHACSQQAMNALLKMVEEGVKNTIFLFASTEDILPTLKSRSVCIDINTIPLDLVKRRILQIATERGTNISDSELDVLALKSQGHMRDALTLLQYFELVGSAALSSPYLLLKSFVANLYSAHPREDVNAILAKILSFPISDIKMSLGLLIRNIYLSVPDTPEYKMRQAGIGKSLFGYFFNPTVQQALRSEVGVEIAFRSFIESRTKKQ